MFRLIIILLFISTLNSYGQLTQIIKGKITDQESKTPILGAGVMLLNSTQLNATASDNNGNFKLVVPVGRVNLKITYIGYEDVLISELEVIAGKETFLNIELREKVSQLEEVVVKPRVDKSLPVNSMASVSTRMISTEDASRYAAGYNDPARMVSSFAGVAPAEGDKNDIVIRGNSPRGLQWKLEGIEIPSPNHFSDGQGDSGGSFCIISSSTLANSDFYTGAFPAEYGNALAGILDLNLRKGNNDKHEFALQVGMVGTEASIEGPIGKTGNASYLINYRYANFQPLNKLGLADFGKNRKAPVFQDVTMNLQFSSKKSGVFSLFFVGGMSTTGKFGIKDSLQWESDDDLATDEVEKHKMGVLGLKHYLPFDNKKTFLKTVVAATGQYDKWDKGFLLKHSDSIWCPGVYKKSFSRLKEEYNTFNYPSLRVSSTLNHKFNASNTLRLGVTFSVLSFSMFAEEYDYDSSYLTKRAVYDVQVDRNGTSALGEAFMQWKYRINERLEMNTGVHYLYFFLNSRYSLEPRFGFKWQLAENAALSYGFGIHSRVESVSAYYSIIRRPDGSRVMPNKDVDFTRSVHNVIGYDWSIRPDIRIKIEAYCQYLYHIPIRNNPHSSESVINAQFGIPDTAYTNSGNGLNKGIELTLEKFYSNNYYFLITGSLYDSKYKAGDGKWYNTYFNGNYLANILGGKDFKVGATRQNVFGLNCKMLIKGGNRYTPFDASKSGDDPYYITNQSFSKQLPCLLRFDMGLKYRQNCHGYSWIVSLDIQNVLDRDNILDYEYNYDENTHSKYFEPVYGLGRIPILNFRIEF